MCAHLRMQTTGSQNEAKGPRATQQHLGTTKQTPLFPFFPSNYTKISKVQLESKTKRRRMRSHIRTKKRDGMHRIARLGGSVSK